MSDDILTVADVKRIVEIELASMSENIVQRARRYLVEPYLSERPWGYGSELFRCWIVMVDDEKSSRTGIAFCEEGVGRADNRWVLAIVRMRDERDADLGQDSGWFSSLEEAFGESFLSEDPV